MLPSCPINLVVLVSKNRSFVIMTPMSKIPRTDYVSWRQLAPIFADVVVSPWNLLVGGVLIQHLSAWKALLSIVIGYSVLSIVFILYGGLGYKKRMESSAILHEVFGNKFSKYVIPVMLALGQLGWAAINISLGGASLALLAHIPVAIGMTLYAVALGGMAALNFYRLAITKIVIVASAALLVLYVAIAKLLNASFFDFLSYQPHTEQSLLWGVSIVVASLVSFATVTPDFFKDARTRADITRSTVLGMVIPGAIMASLGCLLFFDQANYNLTQLIASLAIPLLPQILNVATNTDGSMALYTPALKIIALRKISFQLAVLLATGISLSLALLHIANHLNIWLSALSVMAPVFIGVAFAAVLFDEVASKPFRLLVRRITFWVYGITLLICVAGTIQGPSALFALAVPLLLYSGYVQYRLMRPSQLKPR